MEKITSVSGLQAKYGYTHEDPPGVAMRYLSISRGGLNSDNFWQVREQCRINDGTYTPIRIDGDLKTRFLHVSIDYPAKVSYTKDSYKGKQDIQTRTTLAAYCEKFGLEMTDYVTPGLVRGIGARVDDSMQMAQARAGDIQWPCTQSPVPDLSIRGKLLRIQDLIDEVLADLG